MKRYSSRRPPIPCSTPCGASGTRAPHGDHKLAQLCAQVEARATVQRSPTRTGKARIGRVQFATLGRGNHFIELQRGSDGELWLMGHSGSRGIGQAIRDHHLAQATPASTGLGFLDADEDAGRADLAWALDYAAESRRRMMEFVAGGIERIAGIHALPETAFDCHHNVARREEHDGRALWVHRKGAISAPA